MTDQQAQQTFAVGDRVLVRAPYSRKSKTATVVNVPHDDGDVPFVVDGCAEEEDRVYALETKRVTLVAKALYLDDEDVALLTEIVKQRERNRTEVERNWKPGLVQWDEELRRLRAIIERAAPHGLLDHGDA